MIGLVLAAALSGQATNLSPAATRAIAPVVEAIATERARQAGLPPPAEDRERLKRMGALDQVGRLALNDVDVTALSPEQARLAWDGIGAAIDAVDKENRAALMAMLPKEGWFYRSVWGEEAANAAFHIIQHSDLDLWRRFVPVLEALVANGEVDGQGYVLMYDRLAINEGRPQRYGSQMVCRDGRWAVDTLEDPETVDQRRREVGMISTLAEYEALSARLPACVSD